MSKQVQGSKFTVQGLRFTVYGFLLLFSYSVYAQEMLLEATHNPALVKKYQEIKNSALKLESALDTVSLPFIDDFSKDVIYPDAGLWLDSGAFINRTYPIAPPTIGAATFDGVSKTGCPYDTLIVSANSYPADTLTSKPINLALPPSDSIYLSFFWQAKGKGNDPENYDSLLLQFRNASDTNEATAWHNAWARNGYNPSSSDTSFRLVMIPIKDTAYLKNGFQFRFRNYATISGNVDHWHIDYVFLDKNRNAGDTIFDDVAFVYPSRPLLKNYYAMPWKQYQASEMKTSMSFPLRNNDTASMGKNTLFRDTIFNSDGSMAASYDGGSANVLPYKPNKLIIINGFNDHALSYTFPALTQDSAFMLECVLNTTPDKNRWNDTLRFTQEFSNYYAYDDGTVEAGYGLNVSGGQIAYKFSLNQPDTLKGVYMLFNWIGPNVNQQQFKIRVWGDNGGVPGTMIYEDTLVTPYYPYVYYSGSGNMTNVFTPYLFKTKQPLSGTFYVGFIQYTNPATTLLNLGLDRNTNSNSKMYYDAGGGWTQSVLSGSWMIRPVFGALKGLLNVPDEIQHTPAFTIYPNPSTGNFRITPLLAVNEKIAGVNYIVSVYSSTGQLVAREVIDNLSSEINAADLPNGLYLVRCESGSRLMLSQKLLIAK